MTGGRARPGPRPCGHVFHVALRLVERQTFLKSIRRLKRRHRVRAEHGSCDQRFDLWPAPGCPGQSIDESSHPVNGTLTAFQCRAPRSLLLTPRSLTGRLADESVQLPGGAALAGRPRTLSDRRSRTGPPGAADRRDRSGLARGCATDGGLDQRRAPAEGRQALDRDVPTHTECAIRMTW